MSDHPPPLATSQGALAGPVAAYRGLALVWLSIQALASRLWRSHPLLVALGVISLFCVLRLAAYALLAQSFGGIAHGLCNYDCQWYEQTARDGYDVVPRGDLAGNTANWAFFPLYPILLHAAMLATGAANATWAGIVLSTGFFAGLAILGAAYLGITRFWPLITWLSLVSLWPGAVYFAFPYSEALYAFLMTAALLAMTQQRILTSAWCCAALSATRPTGLLMAPVILFGRLAYIRRARADGELGRRPVAIIGNAILPVAIAPLGLIVFIAYLHWHMGDGLAFMHVQAAWQRHFLSPFTVLWEGLTANDWGRILKHPAEESLSVQASFGWAALLLAIRQCIVGRYAEAWMIGASVLLASSSGLQSVPRFVLTNPVVILALFRWGGIGASPRRLWFIGIALGLLQLGLAIAWFIGAPVLA